MTPLGPGMGCLAISARRHLLERLLQAQEDVNRLREMDPNPLNRTPIQLISLEEIELIRAAWEDDAQHRPYLIDNSEMVPGDWEAAAKRNEERKEARRLKKEQKILEAGGFVQQFLAI
ncbi:hypothetical protein D3C75_842410 [compost metagenome]